MSYPDLQSFMADLQHRDQLRRVSAEVEAVLEITEIADRMMKSPCPEGLAGAPRTDPIHGGRGGRALLFERVKGSDIPVLVNAFGSYARVRLALGCEDLEQIGQRIRDLMRPAVPPTLLGKLKMLPELIRLAGAAPRRVRGGVCQDVVWTDDANLLALPILQCWPHDGDLAFEPPDPVPAEPMVEAEGADGRTGRYITLGQVYMRDRESGVDNVGMYRVQVFGPKLAAIHWHRHHDGARIFRQYAAAGEPMPVAIVLGGEPVLTYAATAPLPAGVSELLFAGFLQGGGIDLCPARTVPLDVPARAEIVIEGWVDPQQQFLEGPFGDHTGFYSLSSAYPVLRVTAITHRRQPIYPATIVGKPPMEDYYLGKATERIFLPLVQMLVPEVMDYHLPMFGAVHNCVFVKIRKEYPYQARKVIHSLWGAGQMMFSKFIVVVDEQVDVHDEQQVLFQIGSNVDPRRDTFLADGPLDILDHAAPFEGAGGKMGIDATRKIPGEGMIRRWPMELEMAEEIRQRVERRWKELGIEG